MSPGGYAFVIPLLPLFNTLVINVAVFPAAGLKIRKRVEFSLQLRVLSRCAINGISAEPQKLKL